MNCIQLLRFADCGKWKCCASKWSELEERNMCQPIQLVHIETHSGADRKVVGALIILAHINCRFHSHIGRQTSIIRVSRPSEANKDNLFYDLQLLSIWLKLKYQFIPAVAGSRVKILSRWFHVNRLRLKCMIACCMIWEQIAWSTDHANISKYEITLLIRSLINFRPSQLQLISVNSIIRPNFVTMMVCAWNRLEADESVHRDNSEVKLMHDSVLLRLDNVGNVDGNVVIED